MLFKFRQMTFVSCHSCVPQRLGPNAARTVMSLWFVAKEPEERMALLQRPITPDFK